MDTKHAFRIRRSASQTRESRDRCPVSYRLFTLSDAGQALRLEGPSPPAQPRFAAANAPSAPRSPLRDRLHKNLETAARSPTFCAASPAQRTERAFALSVKVKYAGRRPAVQKSTCADSLAQESVSEGIPRLSRPDSAVGDPLHKRPSNQFPTFCAAIPAQDFRVESIARLHTLFRGLFF